MPDRLSMHAPVLVNTLGHCAGAIVFGMLLYFLLVEWSRDRYGRSILPVIAAALALLWNVGSLIGLATPGGDPLSDAIVAASFSVLSLLPAVLLQISLGGRRPALLISGYVVSVLAVALHIADLVTDLARFHYAAILLVTIGFGALAAITLGLELRGKERDGSGKRLAGAMVLFLLAISFVHFRVDHAVRGWSGEVALHHAAIPLALFVLLQDYRFLLLDAFIRFLTSGLLAAVTVWLGLAIRQRPLPRDPFETGLAFVGACLLVSLFALVRGWAQRLLTRVVFLRGGSEGALRNLSALSASAGSEAEFLQLTAAKTQEIFSARRTELISQSTLEILDLRHATPVLDHRRYGVPSWVQVIAPLRLARGDVHFFYLGPRAGGRRYLSEDIELLDRMTSQVCEHIEHMRNSEMQTLVAEAEIRALQAQINPHFFFNALNTLYGTIPRESAAARGLVLNLADVFRHSFACQKVSIRIEEELRIVRAYLEIEELRLGVRLRVEIQVDEEALPVEVPVLSIQPLVENAVKHGVAERAGNGFVRLGIRVSETSVAIEVANSGEFGSPVESPGTGMGLENVRRRLKLCFGESGALVVRSSNGLTTVAFSVPLPAKEQLRERTTALHPALKLAAVPRR